MTKICNFFKTDTTRFLEFLTLGFSGLLTLLSLAWMLWYCRYGLDFTDESSYLVWIFNPFNYSVSATQYGFIYHPLYELVRGNIAFLRQANIVITFCLAWVLCNVFLKSVFDGHFPQKIIRLVISSAIATTVLASLAFAGMWLPTPSYNTLALQALLVFTIGLLLVHHSSSPTNIVGCLFIATGGALAFMAKPTTAAILALGMTLYITFSRKFNLRSLAILTAISAGIVILIGYAIDGSIVMFIDRLEGSAQHLATFESGYKLFRLDLPYPGTRITFLFITGTAIIFIAAYFSQLKTRSPQLGSAILSISFAIIGLAVIVGLISISSLGQLQGLLLGTVPLAAILAGLSVNNFSKIPRTHWVMAALLLMLPFAYAFGSGVNYWVHMTGAGIFYVLGGLVLLRQAIPNLMFPVLLVPLGLALQMITIILVQAGMETPYRQPQPLSKNDYQVEVGGPGSVLVMSLGFGQYITQAIRIVNKAQFKKNTPMIDLSGQSPGVLYAIGASSVGQPWMIGGYPGSDKLAFKLLEKIPCEQVAKAWLLVEPNGPRHISSQVLSSFGANMLTDYENVGTLRTAKGAGGYKEMRVQQFLKPIRSTSSAMVACIASRRELNQ